MQSTARIADIPAPTGGWNARDAMPSMKPNDAIVLDNWIPGENGAELRNGFEEHVFGAENNFETLMEYTSPDGVHKLFGAVGTEIYDVTDANEIIIGEVSTAVVVDLSNARWQYTMFGTAGGNFLVACNGADDVLNYDGSVWTTPTITGVASADLINVTSHAGRLWFAEKDSLDAWYLGTTAISGAATIFPLGAFCKLGGKLQAMASWTRDGGAGSDDVMVFITDQGEVLLYSGTDPSSTSTWSKVGTFKIPKPLGRRCAVKQGADVGVITSQGVFALSSILPVAATEQSLLAITDKIGPAFVSAYELAGDAFGWQVIEYSTKGLIIVNVPLSEGVKQFVQNTRAKEKGWCRWLDIEAKCWSPLGDDLYFGDDQGRVCKLNNNYLDDETPITATMMPAFSDFKRAGKKRFLMGLPLMTAAEGTEARMEVRTDYDTTPATVFSVSIPSTGAAWDEEFWDEASWGPALVPISEWQGLEGIGFVGTVVVSLSSRNPISINRMQVTFETGGVL